MIFHFEEDELIKNYIIFIYKNKDWNHIYLENIWKINVK